MLPDANYRWSRARRQLGDATRGYNFGDIFTAKMPNEKKTKCFFSASSHSRFPSSREILFRTEHVRLSKFHYFSIAIAYHTCQLCRESDKIRIFLRRLSAIIINNKFILFPQQYQKYRVYINTNSLFVKVAVANFFISNSFAERWRQINTVLEKRILSEKGHYEVWEHLKCSVFRSFVEIIHDRFWSFNIQWKSQPDGQGKRNW